MRRRPSRRATGAAGRPAATSSGSSLPTVERKPGPTRLPSSCASRPSRGSAAISSMTRSVRCARTPTSPSTSAPRSRATTSRARRSTSELPGSAGWVSMVLVRRSAPVASGGHVWTGRCGPAMSVTNGMARLYSLRRSTPSIETITPNTTSTPPAASVRFSQWCRLASACDHHVGHRADVAGRVVQCVVDVAPPTSSPAQPAAPTSSAETPSAARALPRERAAASVSSAKMPVSTPRRRSPTDPTSTTLAAGRAAVPRTRAP